MHTLVVRHLPTSLSEEHKKDLLKHFGATCVRCMSNKGALKNIAFATFESNESAKIAIRRLHQLEILGCKLVVEFAKEKSSKFHPTIDDKSQIIEEDEKKSENKKKNSSEKEEAMDKFFKVLHSSINGCDYGYPISPLITYKYPPASMPTVQNIAQALLSVPKFYVQVLHLMNKMNLPPPFSSELSQPFMPPFYNIPAYALQEEIESEIESDDEPNNGDKLTCEKVAATKIARRPRKRPRIEQLISRKIEKSETDQKPIDAADVFELNDSSIQKKIEFNLNVNNENHDDVTDDVIVEKGGFGKIEPVAPIVEKCEESSQSCYMELDEYITKEELMKKRISKEEMSKLSVFKRYEVGDLTSRLYIKNLPKQIAEKDILFIYGKYIDWQVDDQKNIFDIRLMTEGRMKGQAFVTFPNEQMAKEALKDTNGFVLHSKPIVVQFARSAKPKDKEEKKGTN